MRPIVLFAAASGAGTSGEVDVDYVRNELNQYYRADAAGPGAPARQNLVYDADGNLTQAFVVGDMNP